MIKIKKMLKKFWEQTINSLVKRSYHRVFYNYIDYTNGIKKGRFLLKIKEQRTQKSSEKMSQKYIEFNKLACLSD